MHEDFESTVQAIAQHLPYPPMPVYRSPARQRNQQMILVLQRVAIVVLVLFVSLMAIPDIRAAVLEFLQIGAVTIYLDGNSTDGTPLNLDDVAGETTLDAAQTQVRFPIRVSPEDLPDRVFVQDQSMVIMVWLDGSKIERALYQATTFDWQIMKTATDTITHTQVGDLDAYWVDVQHPVVFIKDGVEQKEVTHFVTGNVLIWADETITYRLETDQSLDDARAFAESLVDFSNN